jgi:putative DNA primase/helicase
MTTADFIGVLKNHGCDPEQSAKGWKAKCPAHDDGAPSLSVNEGAGGRVLLKCFAGCTAEAIVRAVDLRMSALFADDDGDRPARKPSTVKVGRARNSAARVVATYEYVDPDGDLLAQKRRWEPAKFGNGRKDFDWRHRDSNEPDGWASGRGDKPPVLYRLPEIIQAIQEGRRIFLVEGEKDADSLAAVGLDSTSAPDGATKGADPGSKWLPRFTESLKGANVVIIPDRDEIGRPFANAIAGKIHGVAASVRVVEVPDVGEAKPKDATDFLEGGRDGRAT